MSEYPAAGRRGRSRRAQAGEVRVKIAASGVCHSDYSVIHGVLGAKLPAVLGHEGAGVVEEVGPGVTLVKPGDHVVLSVIASCGYRSLVRSASRFSGTTWDARWGEARCWMEPRG
jgi:D-arabinose 1-dehydrogenase-like Zn-dependent alcohol dehydrogenase